VKPRDAERPLVAVAEGLHRLQVRTGGEGARVARQHEHARALVRDEAREGSVKGVGRGAVDRVPALRTDDADERGGAAPLVDDRVHVPP